MQECTYVPSVASSSQEGPSSTTESDPCSDRVGADLFASEQTPNGPLEGGKPLPPSSTGPPDKPLSGGGGEASPEMTHGSSKGPTKPGGGDAPSGTALSRALGAIAHPAGARTGVRSPLLYRPHRTSTRDRDRDRDQTRHGHGPYGGLHKEREPSGGCKKEEEKGKKDDDGRGGWLHETMPPSSGTSGANNDVDGRQSTTERDDRRTHLPPVTSPYIRRQHPTRRCNSATPALSKLLESSGEKRRNGKDGSLSGRILMTVDPGTGNTSPGTDIPPLGAQRGTKISSVGVLFPSNLQSKRQEVNSPKSGDGEGVFSKPVIPNTHPAYDGSKNKPREAFAACASEVYRLYRNILIHRPRSPLPFIIDQLHQQLEKKSLHETSPDKELKPTSHEVHLDGDESKQCKTPPVEQQPFRLGKLSLDHNLDAQPEELPTKDSVQEALCVDSSVAPAPLTTGSSHGDAILVERGVEKLQGTENAPPLSVSAPNSETKCASCDSGAGNPDEPCSASCDTVCQEQLTCLANPEKSEEGFNTTTRAGKPLTGHVVASVSTHCSSVAPSWGGGIGVASPGCIANTASPHPEAVPLLSYTNPIQRSFNTLSRVNFPQTTTTTTTTNITSATSLLPVFSKRGSLTGSTLAAGSAMDILSSGSDISSVFSAVPVDVQEMLRELQLAKEGRVGMTQGYVTWNELVDILESVSFPEQDAMLLADLFDELWLSQQNRRQKSSADREPAVSGCSSPMTPALWGSGVLGHKQHCGCSPFEGKPVHSAEGLGKNGFPRTQANLNRVQNVAVEAAKDLAVSEKRAASSNASQAQLSVPIVRFDTFLACMAYKIQGRYPVEVIRQAFFELVEKCGATHTVTSDAVSHKLGLVLESSTPTTALSHPSKETETHSRKRGQASATRSNPNNDTTTELTTTFDINSNTDAILNKSSDSPSKGPESVLGTKLLREEIGECSSPNSSSFGTAIVKENSQVSSNLTTHVDLMGSITGSSRLFSPHLTVMAQTVPLRVCVVEGIQGLLGLSNFDGSDVEQALSMAGQPLQNLDYHCHLDEFIRLVHCMTMLMNRKLMNSSHPSKGTNFLYPTLVRGATSVTASGNAGYSCSSNNTNSMSRSENEGNPILFSMNTNYAAR